MPLLWYCVHSASEANRRGEMNWNIFVGRKKKEESHQQSLLESANRHTRSCFLLIGFC